MADDDSKRAPDRQVQLGEASGHGVQVFEYDALSLSDEIFDLKILLS